MSNCDQNSPNTSFNGNSTNHSSPYIQISSPGSSFQGLTAPYHSNDEAVLALSHILVSDGEKSPQEQNSSTFPGGNLQVPLHNDISQEPLYTTWGFRDDIRHAPEIDSSNEDELSTTDQSHEFLLFPHRSLHYHPHATVIPSLYIPPLVQIPPIHQGPTQTPCPLLLSLEPSSNDVEHLQNEPNPDFSFSSPHFNPNNNSLREPSTPKPKTSAEIAEEAANAMFTPLEELSPDQLGSLDLEHIDRFTKQSRLDSILWRVGLCFLSVLFVWLTSSIVVTTFVSYAIPSPPFSQVTDRWEVTVSAVQNEIKQTSMCIDQASLSCAKEIQEGRLAFHAALSDTFFQLDTATALSNARFDPCQLKYNTVINALQTHHSLKAPVIYDTTRCSQQEINTVRKLVGEEEVPQYIGSIQQQLNETLSAWSENFGNFSQSVKARYDYDRDWFSTRAAITRDAAQIVINKINEARLRIMELKIRLNFVDPMLNFPELGLINSVQPVVDMFEDLFQKMTIIFNNGRKVFSELLAFKDMIPNIPSMGSVFPDNFLNFSDFNLSKQVMLDKQFDWIRNFFMTYFTQIEEKFDEIEVLLTQIMAIATTSLQEIHLPIDLPSISLDPKFDLNLVVNLKIAKIDNLLRKLVNFGSSAKTEVKDFVIEAFEKVSISQVVELILPNINLNPWSLLPSNASMEPILDTVSTVMSILGGFDIAYRVFSTLNMLFLYAKVTQSQLAGIDLRRDGDQNQAIDFLSKLPYGILGPALTVGTLLLFILIAFLYIVFSYVGLYQGYVEGCVKGDDGTFLAQNAHIIASNLAHDSTRLYRGAKQQTHISTAFSVCQNETATAEYQFNKYSLGFQLNKRLYQQYSSDLALIDRCIISPLTYTNINPVDSDDGSLHTGAFLQTFSPLNDTATKMLDEEIPNDDIETPKTSPKSNFTKIETKYVNRQYVYNSYLNECDVFVVNNYPWDGFEKSIPATASMNSFCGSFVPQSCTELDMCTYSDSTLRIATRNSSCDTEWFVHAFLIKALLIVFVMICFNLSRTLLIKFFTTYFFDKLGNTNVEILEFYRYHDEPRSTVSVTDRRVAVKSALDSHRLQAIVFLVASVLCNVPYLFAVFYMMRNIAPKRI